MPSAERPPASLARRILIALAALVLGLAAVVALLLALNLPLNLNRLRAPLAAAATQILGREVSMVGDVHLVPGLWPTLGIEDVRIANPDGFTGESFARFGAAHAQLSLLALLRRELGISEVELVGAHIALETTAEGRNNWTFDVASTRTRSGTLEIPSLEVRDVLISYRAGSTGASYELAIDALRGSLRPDELVLTIEGRAQEHPYALSLRTDPLHEILDLHEPWDLDVDGRVAGIPVSGTARIDMTEDGTGGELTLGAQDGEVGELVEMLTELEGVEGRFARLELRAATAGDHLHEWANALALSFELTDGALSYGNRPGERPVGFTLEAFALDLEPGGRVGGRARGSLLGEPAAGTFRGGRVVTRLDGLPWPLEVEAEGAGASLRIAGTFAAPATAGSSDRFRVEVQGNRVGDLAPWLGVPESAPATYAVAGDLEIGTRGITFSSASLALGRTRARGELAWLRDQAPPRPSVELHATALDIGEARKNLGLTPEEDEDASAGLSVDCPILPDEIPVEDADLVIRVDRLILAPSDVTDVAFSGRMRGARIERTPFTARYAGVDLAGELDLDLGGEIPAGAVRAATGAVDLGQLGRALGLVANLDARASRVALDLRTRGRTTRELLAGATFEAVAEEGVWEVHADLVDTALHLRRTSLHGRPGAPVLAEFEGDLRSVPVRIDLELPPLVDLTLPEKSIPARARAEAGGARLDVSMRLDVPIRYAQGDVDFELGGDWLSDLGPLLGVSLPGFGPYYAKGILSAKRPARYEAAYRLRVRDSTLSGTTRIDAAGERPMVHATLDAETIQLADFRYVDPTPASRGTATPSSASGAMAQVEPFLSRKVLGSFDGEATLDVGVVRSGQDSLGRGTLRATLRDGRLVVDPLELDVPGGRVELALTAEPGREEMAATLRARIEEFDYGILARRLDPNATTRGLISLAADLDARGPDLQTLAPGMNGWLEVAVKPENMNAGVLEMWAVNLLRATLRLLSPFSRTRVNCAVGAFELDEGRLESRAMLVDTSSMQVHGEGFADFGSGALRFVFKPRPKRREVLSLALPVVAEGTIRSFSTRIQREGVVRALLRNVRNAVQIPMDRLLRRSLPRDGSAACADTLRTAREQRTANAP